MAANPAAGLRAVLRSVWQFRQFILGSIANEFRTRFARSRLGAMWMVLNPLAQAAIFAFILSGLLSSRLPGIASPHAYPIYLLAGILGWSLFAEVVSRCLTVFIDHGNLLKKMAFPRIALPAILVGVALVNLVLLAVAVLVVYAVLGHLPLRALHWLPLLAALTLALATGLGLSLGIVNVFVRDTGQVMGIVLQFWYWLTPIVYTLDTVPAAYRHWLGWNPMLPVIAGFQSVLAYDRAPDLSSLALPAACAAASLGLALWLYRQADEELTDAL